MADGPLRGVRLLDLTHVWAGPLAVRALADLGADVVKIEAPFGRGPRVYPEEPIGGFLAGDPGDEPWNRNAVFVKLMRNRRSVCIDLKQPAGRETLLELVREADVLVENFSARALPDLGLDHATLASANPRLIHASMPGFGGTGPYAGRVAFGPTVEPLTGLTSVMGYGPDEPRATGIAVMDPTSALAAAAAVLAALRRREETGIGCRIEIALHESGVGYSGPWLIDHQLGRHHQPLGNRHPAMAPNGIYRCAGDDAWVAISCPDDVAWAGLCREVEGLDARLDLAARARDHDLIDQSIERWTRSLGKAEAAARLRAAGVPAGAVNSTPDMLADAQVKFRGFFVPLEPGPSVGSKGKESGDSRIPVPGNAVHMPGVSSADWTPCPRLGADNEGVLAEWLGWDEERIVQMSGTVLHDRPPG
jgi:crotonobetainyl-CoA:carnitine CoA-transferase CaiB-like acyl-CoA transferase